MSTDAELQAAGIAVPKRTDLPWVWDADFPCGVYSDDPTGSIIATTKFDFEPRSDDAEKGANAQFIVAAVNAHDDLVAALKQADRLISKMATVILDKKCADYIPYGLEAQVREHLGSRAVVDLLSKAGAL